MKKLHFGKGSKKKLSTVSVLLQRVATRALSYGIMDFSIVEGRREREKQDEYFNTGKSKVKWPNGKHNVLNDADLASAFDAVPYINGKLSWRKEHCLVLSGLMLAAAKEEGVTIRWGGNWDMDGEPVTDQDFQDLVHFEER